MKEKYCTKNKAKKIIADRDKNGWSIWKLSDEYDMEEFTVYQILKDYGRIGKRSNRLRRFICELKMNIFWLVKKRR